MLNILKGILLGKKEKKKINEFKVDINGEESQVKAELNKAIKENKQRLMDLHRVEFTNKEIMEKKNKFVKALYSALRLVENDSKHIFLLRQFHLVDFPEIIKKIDAIDDVKKIKNVRIDVMETLIDEASMSVVESIQLAAKNLEKVKA